MQEMGVDLADDRRCTLGVTATSAVGGVSGESRMLAALSAATLTFVKNRDAVALGRLGGRPPANGARPRRNVETRPIAAEDRSNPHAVALGRLGGRKGAARGGHQRAKALSARRRAEIAADAARVRWGGLPERLRHLFPGYHFEEITLPDQLDLVMLHVLSQGGPEDLRWLVRRVGHTAIRRWILRKRGLGLTIRQMTPWVSERTARKWQRANPLARLWEER
jgi:hypothetical protein